MPELLTQGDGLLACQSDRLQIGMVADIKLMRDKAD
jgi:hypothetical protein